MSWFYIFLGVLRSFDLCSFQKFRGVHFLILLNCLPRLGMKSQINQCWKFDSILQVHLHHRRRPRARHPAHAVGVLLAPLPLPLLHPLVRRRPSQGHARLRTRVLCAVPGLNYVQESAVTVTPSPSGIGRIINITDFHSIRTFSAYIRSFLAQKTVTVADCQSKRCHYNRRLLYL